MKGLRRFSPKTATIALAAIVFLVSFGLYFNTLSCGFVMDDSFQVTGNRWIKNIRYFPAIFSSSFVLGGKWSFYRPLIHVIYMTTYYLFGLEPWGYHLVNILFHAANSTFVFFIAAHLLRKSRQSVALPPSVEMGNEGPQWIPFAAALLFATHPIHTESVAWVSVTDPFLSFFYLLSFYLYIRSADSDSSLRGAYPMSVVSYIFAALCKEPGLTLPAVLMAYDYAVRSEGARLSYYFKRYVPFLAVASMYFILRLHALGSLVPFKSTPLESSTAQDAVNIIVLFMKYIEKLFFPINLNVWHAFLPPNTFFTLTGLVSGLVMICFLTIVVIAVRKSRVSLLGFMFIVAPLLPALYLPAITQGLDNAFFERYVYLPSVGFILLIAFVLVRIKEQRPDWNAALVIAVSALIVAYSIGTVSRIPAWKDNYTIWSDAVRKSPSSAVPRNGLAAALREDGHNDDAIEQYMISIKLDPTNPSSHASLGLVYFDKGWTEKAIEQFQTALNMYPGYAEAHDFLGVLYGSLRQYERAVKEFQAALNLNPDLDYIYKHLGIAYSNLGLTEKAIECFQMALQRDPDDADTHNNIGVEYGQKGLMEKAVAHFEAAARLNPADPAPHYNASKAFTALGRADKAEEHVRAARRLEEVKP
jgi:Flp pilus assembly protein TadD